VPSGIGASTGDIACGKRVLTLGVFHAWARPGRHSGQNGSVQGETVPPETLIKETTTDDFDEVEELLVEEVSIDGLCGVY
jgi:mycofactocin precursor